jgi:hypothetical protein
VKNLNKIKEKLSLPQVPGSADEAQKAATSSRVPSEGEWLRNELE